MSQSNSRSSPAADVNMDVMVTDSLPVVPAPVVSVPVVSAPALSAPVVVDASSLRNDVNSLRMELVILGSQYYRRADDQVLADLQLQIDSKTKDLQVLSKMLADVEAGGSCSAGAGAGAPWSSGLGAGAGAISVSCPSNLSAFQWVGKVHDGSARVFADVEACIMHFEDVMFANSFDTNYWYLRWVPQFLSREARLWYNQFLSQNTGSSPSWEAFKSAFSSRFGRSASQEQAKCALTLSNIFMLPGEGFSAFVDRFGDLRRRAGS